MLIKIKTERCRVKLDKCFCVSSSYQSPVFSFSPVALRAFRRLVLGKRWSHQVHQAEWHHAPVRYTTQCRGRWPWNRPPVNKRDRDINKKKIYRDWPWHCLLVIKPFWLMKWCLPRFCFHLWLQDTKLRLLVKYVGFHRLRPAQWFPISCSMHLTGPR